MRYYLETSALLLVLSDSQEGSEAREGLLGCKGDAAVSDLVLSEIYNLPEPAKDRLTRFVVELGVPTMRLSPSCVTLSEKYVYNRIIQGEQRDWGLHIATATVRGFSHIVTADRVISRLIGETNPVNAREGYNEVSLTLLKNGNDLEASRWFDELTKIRELSYQATSKRGMRDLLQGVETSALHLMKEKSVTIERIGSIEIF